MRAQDDSLGVQSGMMSELRLPRTHQYSLLGDLRILVLLALARVVLHLLVNGQYGFHRDELATLDDARYMDWGFVAYPPVTPAIAHLAVALFGPSLIGIRLFAALSQAISMVLAGLLVRELGGSRWSQVIAAIAIAISPASLAAGALFQYVSFDYLWWVLIAYLIARLLRSGNPRYWFGIGAIIGLGMMTKYTILFLVAGLAVGVLLTRERRNLASPWLWAGVALSLLVFLPNMIWQLQHNFVSLEFLSSIHERDVRIGRTGGYLIEQLFVTANPFTIPLWVMGLYFYFFSPTGKQHRLLGWMFVIPFILFFLAQGRSYYMAPAYPMLVAAGAVVWERWLASLSTLPARLLNGVTWAGLMSGVVMGAALMLPVFPINSDQWNAVSGVHDLFTEQVGWPDLVETVAGVYAALPEKERAQAAILAGNYGEAGAINLYGPAYGLPEAISGINSYHLRGYSSPPPETVVVVGFSRDLVDRMFQECQWAARNTNRYGVVNEETRDHPDIFVCRKPRLPWPDLWKQLRYFG